MVPFLHADLRHRGPRAVPSDGTPYLVREIRVVPIDGELRIEIKGVLAGILELCQEGTKRKPGGLSTAGLAEQIQMVAGEGNHRQLTLPPVSALNSVPRSVPALVISIANG